MEKKKNGEKAEEDVKAERTRQRFLDEPSLDFREHSHILNDLRDILHFAYITFPVGPAFFSLMLLALGDFLPSYRSTRMISPRQRSDSMSTPTFILKCFER